MVRVQMPPPPFLFPPDKFRGSQLMMAGKIRPLYELGKRNVVRTFVSLATTPFGWQTTTDSYLHGVIHNNAEVKDAFVFMLEMVGDRLVQPDYKPICERYKKFLGLVTVPPVGHMPMVTLSLWRPGTDNYLFKHYCNGPALDYEERIDFQDKFHEKNQPAYLRCWMNEFGKWIHPSYDQEDPEEYENFAPRAVKRPRLSVDPEEDSDTSIEVLYDGPTQQ